MGGRLQSIYTQAGQMTQTAQKALEHMGVDADKSVIAVITGAALRALADFEPEQSMIAERLQTIRSICGHLRKLHQLSGNLHRISRALKIVAININIESCRACEFQDSFSVLSQEIRALSTSVTTLARTLSDEIQTTEGKLETMQAAMQANLSRFSRVAKDAHNMVEQADPQCRLLMERSVSVLKKVGVDAEAISKSTGQIVVNLQIHDNVSQRVDHIVKALNDAQLGINQPYSDTTDEGIRSDQINAIDANLELQQAQLEHIMADIDGVFQESAQAFNAIGDTIRNVSAGVLQIAWGQTLTGSNSIKEAGSIYSLKAVLEKIRALVGQGDKTVAELKDVGRNATEAVARIGEHMEQVRNVNVDIHLKALNAIFKSTQLGDRGRAIGALVQEMKDLAKQSNHLVEQMESISRAIMDQSGQLQIDLQDGISNRQEGTAVSADVLDTAIDNFSETSTAFTGQSDEMAALGRTIDSEIRAASDQLKFLSPFAGELGAQLEQIIACRQQLAPCVTTTGHTGLLDKSHLSGRYTMQQERSIHAAILDAKASNFTVPSTTDQQTETADQGPESFTDIFSDNTEQDDLGDNVELF